MKRILFFYFFIFLAFFSFSQENTNDTIPSYTNKKHFIGLNAGGTTGLVFSYRYMPKDLGVQVSLLPTGEKGSFWGDLGVTVLYNIYASPHNKVHLFNYWGNSIIYSYNYTENLMWNSGIGYGIDIRGHERISFGFMIGWGAYDITDDYAFYPDGTTYLFYRF